MPAVLAFAQSHPSVHLAIEWLAYFVGGRVYFHERRAAPLDIPRSEQLLLLGSAVLGAALGALALHDAQSWSWVRQQPPLAWLSGKSVLGGLLGGTMATELVKRHLGCTASTGDAWVPALAVGLVLGRVGCQLSGPWDMTYGAPTRLGWGWDYGDGIPRWPTAAIESLCVLAAWRLLRRGVRGPAGSLFNAFMLSYCLLRFGIEFLKPPFGAAVAGQQLPMDRYGGLTAIQWTAAAGALWMLQRLRHPAALA